MPRHDLHARDEPFVDPLRQVHDFLQEPVEAVPDEHALFHRLDVDVARAARDGALDDEIDEVDDRRRIRALARAGRQPPAARTRRLRRGTSASRVTRGSAPARRPGLSPARRDPSSAAVTAAM